MIKTTAGVAVLLVLVYGAFKLLPLIQGPSLEVTSPAEGQSFTAHTLIISGKAHHTETLLLNGSVLPIDATGAFYTSLTLPSGGAILVLTATDRFGKKKTLERSVFITE